MSHDHGHACAHGHDHGHGHGHHGHAHPTPGPNDWNRAFAIGIVLNLGFVVVEALYGWKAGSLALLADAGHNLSDVAGLILAWGAALAGRLAPTRQRTYGWQRASILAALANAVLLLVAMGALAVEAFQRLQAPEPVAGWTVIVVAAGVLYLQFGWVWLDPVMSLVIALVIVLGTWGLLRQSLHLAFDGVPDGIDLLEVHAWLRSLPGVTGVHDLHVWALGTSEVALTAHLVMPAGHPGDAFFTDLAQVLAQRFRIRHPTIQIEIDGIDDGCPAPHVPG